MTTNRKLKTVLYISLFTILCLVLFVNHFIKSKQNEDLNATKSPKSTVSAAATERIITLPPTLVPTSEPTPSPESTTYIFWELVLGGDKYVLQRNSIGEVVLTSLELTKSVLASNEGLDFNPTYKFLFFKVTDNGMKQIPNQEFFPQLSLENTKPDGGSMS
jgi:hypothetical protein